MFLLIVMFCGTFIKTLLHIKTYLDFVILVQLTNYGFIATALPTMVIRSFKLHEGTGPDGGPEFREPVIKFVSCVVPFARIALYGSIYTTICLTVERFLGK